MNHGSRVFRNRLWIALFLVNGPIIAWSAAPEPPGPEQLDQYLRQQVDAMGLPGLSVAVVRNQSVVYERSLGVSSRESREPAGPDTVYAIGSITKVFTATLLVELRDRGVVRLDDPIAKYLPEVVTLPGDPRGAPAITLRHLATHTSGLPRLPVNLAARGEDPYGGYTVEQLYDGLSRTKLESPVGATVRYSNLGAALLGHTLSLAAKERYDQLLRDHLLLPIGMNDSGLISDGQFRSRLAKGYRSEDTNLPAVEWDLGCLGPAGGIVSTPRDMARFLSLQLRAAQAGVKPVSGGSLHEMQTAQRVEDDWQSGIGLGWIISHERALGNVVWHNGGLAGFTSYIAFAPKHRVGVVALTNCGKGIDEVGRKLLLEAVTIYGVAEYPPINQMAEGLAPFFHDAPGDQLADWFHADFLSAVPLESVKAIFRGIHAAHGRCTGVEFPRAEPPQGHSRIQFRFADGAAMVCDLAVSDGDPPKITYLMFPPGE